MPSPGLGTSVSTLSVEISSSGSSRAISSPSCLSQRVTVPFGHGDAHLGHHDLDLGSRAAHLSSCRGVARRPQYAARSRSAAATSSTCGMYAFSSVGANGTGASGAATTPDRRVELLERLLRDRRRDLGAEAAGLRVLVEDERLRAARDALEHRLAVPRDQRPEVEDLDGDPLLGELRRRVVRRVDHRAPRDHRHVVALAVDARLPERRRVPVVGHLALDPPVQVLVLEVEDRVRVLDRGREQALRVLRRRRADDLEARDVGEARLGVLRVERPAGEAAARRAGAGRSGSACPPGSAASRRP